MIRTDFTAHKQILFYWIEMNLGIYTISEHETVF